MRANSLVPILSEIFDFPFDAAQRIDRVLAEAGMRAKAKGRNLPDMERREALTLLVACMITNKITKANEEVMQWLRARGEVNEAPSLEAQREWNIPDSESEHYQHHIAMEALLAPYKGQDGAVDLIDYLVALCQLIEKKGLVPERFQFDIDFSDLSASVVMNDEDESKLLKDQFFVIDLETKLPLKRNFITTGIKRKCSINGAALYEIIKRT